MSAIAVLALKNNAAVSQTFSPSGIDQSGVASWQTTSESIYDARRKVTQSVNLPKNGSSVVRVKQKIALPVMDAIDNTKKAGEMYANIEYVFPKNASLTGRLDLRAHVAELTSAGVTTDAVSNFENAY